jgi:putative DNA primase/helicase
VEGTPHKKDGSILLFGDPPISGGFQNYRDGKGWENWTSGNGNGNGSKLTAEEVRAAKARQEKIRQAREQERADRQKEAAAEARNIWEGAGPADPSHPYLAKKKIKPNILRMRGNGILIVPMTDESGSLVNLQRIDGNGEKRFLPGGKVVGTFSSFGPTPDPSGPIMIVEGVSTGLSVFEATGFSVVSAMSADNLPAVAKTFRARNPKAKLIIFADHDTKETHGHTRGVEAAEEAAKACGASIALSPTPGDDANDLYVFDNLILSRRDP